MAAEAKPGNGYDINKLNGYLDRMSAIEVEKASIMGRAMQECKTLSEDQKEIKQEAKDAGIRPKVFGEFWKARKATEASETSLTALEGDDREQIEEMLRQASDDKAFAGTPFGAHLIAVFSNA